MAPAGSEVNLLLLSIPAYYAHLAPNMHRGVPLGDTKAMWKVITFLNIIKHSALKSEIFQHKGLEVWTPHKPPLQRVRD